MLEGTTVIPITLREDPSLELDPRYAASFGADNLLLSSFVVALGIPALYAVGLQQSPLAVAGYSTSAALLASVIAVGAWWIRWNRPCGAVCRLILRDVLLFSVPAGVLAYGAVVAGQDLSLVGVAIMAFAAAIAVSATSAVFHYDSGSRLMGVLRLGVIVATPLMILAMAETLPRGLVAIQGWSIPVTVTAAGAFGAYKAVQRHGYEHADEQKVTLR